jgi:hypothetical protein
VNFLVWEDIAEINLSGIKRKLAIDGQNRIIAYVEDGERCVLYTVECLVSLMNFGMSIWLVSIVLVD